MSVALIVVYVIEGDGPRKRYVGITNDLSRRLAEHRSGNTIASRLIGNFRLVHQELFPDHASARQREIFLKSGQGRKWLDQFLSSDPPEADKASPPQEGACSPLANSIPSPATFFY